MQYDAVCIASIFFMDLFLVFPSILAFLRGPLSEVAEISVGALPLVTAPTLVSALYENCTMTWEWSPAIERGKLVHSYDLKVERVNTSAELLIPFDGNSSAPYRVSVATVSSDTWTEAVPGVGRIIRFGSPWDLEPLLL